MLIRGTGGDVLLGEADEDTVSAGYGNDTVAGGGGADSLLGQVGNDRLLGGEGPDKIWGGAGADRLEGGPDPDQIMASAESTVDGGDEYDRIYLRDEGGPTPPTGDDTVDARDGRPSARQAPPRGERPQREAPARPSPYAATAL